MCGIAGIFDLRGDRPIARGVIRRMTDTLAHRGPDGEGFLIEPGVALGHRRLAIIDIAGGKQPFATASGAGALTYNGELYNFRALRDDLAQSGHRARTGSDTEALAEGLERKGAAYIDRIEGMFAFAFWRRDSNSLLLARDRVGEKPLYYAETADGFLVFASELQAVMASGMVDDAFDMAAVSDYLLYGYVPDPKTIYRSVRKLPPGSTIEAAKGRSLTIRRYWKPRFDIDAALDYEATAGALIERLDEAVRKQMIADVPLGAFLSGGVDSSAIVASMSAAGARATTITIGFAEEDFDERPYARMVADRYGADAREAVVSMDAAALIDRIAIAHGEPFADASALPTFLVCREARRHVTVALSGDGGDELFAGYRRYPFFLAEENVRRRIPAALRRHVFGPLGDIWPKLDWAPRPLRLKTTLQSIGDDRAAAYARAASASLPDRAAAMMSDAALGALDGYRPTDVIAAAMDAAGTDDPLAQLQAVDFATWLPGRMLVKVDRAAMANSLEVRPPMLDASFVAFAQTLPAAFKLKGFDGKRILKRALEPRLPDEILYRKKQGFGLPLADWMRAVDGPASALGDSRAWRDSGLIDGRCVDDMRARHRSGASDYSQELWSVVMLDAFLRTRSAGAAAVSARDEDEPAASLASA